MVTIHCMKEAVWLRQLLAGVRYVQEEPTSIMCDNQGCIALGKNPPHNSRTKHIQHHFIREKLENQKICLKYCPTEDMIADVITKPLAKDRLQTLTNALDLLSLLTEWECRR